MGCYIRLAPYLGRWAGNKRPEQGHRGDEPDSGAERALNRVVLSWLNVSMESSLRV